MGVEVVVGKFKVRVWGRTGMEEIKAGRGDSGKG